MTWMPGAPELITSFLLAALSSILLSGGLYGLLKARTWHRPALAQRRGYWLSGALGCALSFPLAWLAWFVALLLLAEPTNNSPLLPRIPTDAVQIPLDSLLLSLWLVGSLGALLRQHGGALRLKRMLRDSEAAPPALARKLAAWTAACPVHTQSTPTFRVCRDQVSPFALAGPQDRVMLTAAALKFLSDDELRLVVWHELTHLQYRDPQCFRRLAWLKAWLWFNPFYALLMRELKIAVELHCDSQVLAAAPHEADSYAAAFLRLVRVSVLISPNHLAASSFAGRFRARVIRQRLVNIRQGERAKGPASADAKSRPEVQRGKAI